MTKTTDYQALSRELDEIIAQLQSPDIDIDEAVRLYDRGMAIAKELDTYLKTAEIKITKLKSEWSTKPSKA